MEKMTEEFVKKVQALLIFLGYDDGKLIANGIFDDATAEALSEYQNVNGLTVTGKIDEETKSTMFSDHRYKMADIDGEDEADDQEDPCELDEEEASPARKQLQAALILHGYGKEGKLIADGYNSDMFLETLFEYAADNLVTDPIYFCDDTPIEEEAAEENGEQ